MKEVLIPNFGSEKNDYLQLTLEGVEGFDSACIIHLDGFIDTYNSSFFQTKVTKIVAFNYKALIFDCKNLSYVSSTGIGAFINLWKAIRLQGGNFVFLDVQSKVMEVFQLLGFSKSFTFADSMDEAIAAFKK